MSKRVNGREYPLWNQFVDGQDKFIGGVLEDFGDNDPLIKNQYGKTTITGITLEPNGDKKAFFQVNGEDFSCGFDPEYGGIQGGEDGWITFFGYGGHTWRIQGALPSSSNLLEKRGRNRR